MDCPQNCNFTYHSVIPPTHCPHCGRCLGCGAPNYPYPVTPWRPAPYYPGTPWRGPYYTGDPITAPPTIWSTNT